MCSNHLLGSGHFLAGDFFPSYQLPFEPFEVCLFHIASFECFGVISIVALPSSLEAEGVPPLEVGDSLLIFSTLALKF